TPPSFPTRRSSDLAAYGRHRLRDPEAHALSDSAARVRPWGFRESGIRRNPRRDPDCPVHARRRPQHEADSAEDRPCAEAVAAANGALDSVSCRNARNLHRVARRILLNADWITARRDVRIATRP